MDDQRIALGSSGEGERRHFGIETSFALFSGGLSPETAAASVEQFVAGADWVRAEDKPKAQEPEFNVYHYVIGHSGEKGYPVFACGKQGAIAPHWSTLNNLVVYEK